MELSRYTKLREEMIDAYKKIKYQPYDVWIAPKSLMSVDEIRERSNFEFEGTGGDPDYYDREEKRSMTMWKMIQNLNNFQTFNDISFQRPNTDIIDIYETIQSYILNWCTIIRNVPEYGTIHLNELKQLENLAYVLFDRYRLIKPFVVGYKQRQQNKLNEGQSEEVKEGLVGLALLLGRESLFNGQAKFRNDDDSFISHVDQLKVWLNGGVQQEFSPLVQQPYFKPIEVEDSIMNLNDNQSNPTGLLDWYKGRS